MDVVQRVIEKAVDPHKAEREAIRKDIVAMYPGHGFPEDHHQAWLGAVVERELERRLKQRAEVQKARAEHERWLRNLTHQELAFLGLWDRRLAELPLPKMARRSTPPRRSVPTPEPSPAETLTRQARVPERARSKPTLAALRKAARV